MRNIFYTSIMKPVLSNGLGCIILVLLLSSSALAQKKTVSGKVTDAKTSKSMPGANIVVQGTQTGTSANAKGHYELTVESLQDTLEFSFVGYRTRQIPINGRTTINITLKATQKSLEQMVVIGYGSQKQKNLTGSISKITSENLNTEGVNTSVNQALTGEIAGVNVVQNSGEPGGAASVQIRGVGSINAGNSPLYVVDGVPIDNSIPVTGSGNQVTPNNSPRDPLSAINPDDIESVEVLKDASATAIYGSRGANGVILITTKKGKTGGLKINYSGQFGVQRVSHRLDLLNAQQYKRGINALIDAGGGDASLKVKRIQNGGTDWQDVIFRNDAPIIKNNLSFSGGSDNFTYLVSLNNARQNGLMKKTSYDRYGVRANLNYNSDKWDIGLHLTTSYIKDKFKPHGFDYARRGGVINAAKNYDPTLSVKDASGNYVPNPNLPIDNPLAAITGTHSYRNRYRTIGDISAQYTILPGLSLKAKIGGDTNIQDKKVYKDRTTLIGNSLGGVATGYNGNVSNYLLEGTVHYKKTFFNRHTIKLLGGITSQSFMSNGNTIEGNDFLTDATKAFNFSLADRSTITANSYKNKHKLLSYFGRMHYSYRDRYLLTATYRIDGSSRFGPSNKYGQFPSVAVGWRVGKEKPLASLKKINELKLRASWGKTGNQDIGNYQYLSTYRPGIPYVLDGEFTNSLNPSRIPNSNLQWETTEQYDAGLDFSFFNNRLSGSFDWYRKKTYNMLLNLPVPSSSGYNSKLTNIGSMRNSGIEFNLKSNNIESKKFNWTTDVNFTTLKNEVINLGGQSRIISGNAIIKPGKPVRSFFGYDVIGIWQKDDDFSSISNNVKPGDFKFRDVNGDGTIDGKDRIILGNSLPHYQFGLGNTVSYKDFSLRFLFNGVKGLKMYNRDLELVYFPKYGVRTNRYAKPFLNRWTPENPTNKQPSFNNANQVGKGVNSKTVVDASYIKLQNVRLSYNVPRRLLNGIARSIEVYVSAQNLVTISNYDGFDPALNPAGNADFRQDWNGYPSATTYMGGVNIDF